MAEQIPPRNGEEDHAQHGGGVFAARPEATKLARRERRSGNLPEVLLWRELRERPDGFKFRRQHPIGRYVLDFAYLSARLAVEIDGEAHTRGDRPRRDLERDAVLVEAGFRVLRLSACEVLASVEEAIIAIVSACRAGEPLHRPAAGLPSRSGEVSP